METHCYTYAHCYDLNLSYNQQSGRGAGVGHRWH